MLAIPAQLDPPPAVRLFIMESAAPPDHTSGPLVCLCMARPSLCPDLTLVCGVDWGGQGICLFGLGNAVKWQPSLPVAVLALTVSEPAHTHSLWVESSLLLSVCLREFPSRRGVFLVCAGSQEWDAKIVAWPACSPEWRSTHVDLLFLSDPSQGCRSQPDAFFFFTSYLASQMLLVVKNPPANAGDLKRCGFDPWSGRSTGGGHGNPLHAWRIPWSEEPCRLQFIGSQRVGHDWSDLARIAPCYVELFIAALVVCIEVLLPVSS